jgi:hypothetical protein
MTPEERSRTAHNCSVSEPVGEVQNRLGVNKDRTMASFYGLSDNGRWNSM